MKRRGGFSLLELLVVMAILGIVAGLAAPVMINLVQAGRLGTCASNLTQQLNAARMLAIRLNQPVEVRFFQYLDREMPGATPTYRAYQLWLEGRPYQNVVKLDTGVILSTMKDAGGDPWSSVLDPQKNISCADLPLAADIVLPGALPNTTVKNSFLRFRPDGSTNLSSAHSWTLTLLPEKDAARTVLPSNFVTIVIEPLNGTVRALSP